MTDQTSPGLDQAECRNVVRQIRAAATKIEGALNAQLGRLADRGPVESLRRLADRIAHDAGIDNPEGVAPDDDDEPAEEEGRAVQVEIVDEVGAGDTTAG